MNTIKYNQIGTVIHGTLNPDDLISTFEDLLVKLGEKEIDYEDYEDYEKIEYLIEKLNEYAMPYCYFGNTEGDGSDFGFWPDMLQIELDVQDKELPVYNDIPDDIPNTNFLMVVNCHGNMIMYQIVQISKSFCETRFLWSVV